MFSVLPQRHYRTWIKTEPHRAVFPYLNFWRGHYASSFPRIAEREAGHTPRIYPRVIPESATGHAYPDHCFEPVPSTKYPCYPECTEEFIRTNPFLQNSSRVYLFR